MALLSEKEWKRGSETFMADHEGVTYFFQTAEERDLFQKTPGKFIPELQAAIWSSYRLIGEQKWEPLSTAHFTRDACSFSRALRIARSFSGILHGTPMASRLSPSRIRNNFRFSR